MCVSEERSASIMLCEVNILFSYIRLHTQYYKRIKTLAQES